ncbi:hypothetical protein CPB85DRAFT_1252873 [Mucidula mucida]|nr:hypothetical protein CPB85DRAFT_1252873 [Mucidula mucida]
MSVHSDTKDSKGASSGDIVEAHEHDDWSADEERKLVRKMDWRCMPALIILFILNFIDRGNLSNARLKGLQEDLHLDDTQYSTCLSVLFAGYIFMQIPSNLIMNSIPYPRLFMSAVVTLWGAVSAFTALCHDFPHLVVCRFFLGFIEAAFYPASVYYLSRWYTRKEIGLRMLSLTQETCWPKARRSSCCRYPERYGRRSRHPRLEMAVHHRRQHNRCIRLIIPFILADYPTTERMIAQGRLVKDIGLVDNPDEQEKSGSGVWHGVVLALTDSKFGVWLLANDYADARVLDDDHALLTFPPWAFATLFALANHGTLIDRGEVFPHRAQLFVRASGVHCRIICEDRGGKIYISLRHVHGLQRRHHSAGLDQLFDPSPARQARRINRLRQCLCQHRSNPNIVSVAIKWGSKYWQSFVTEICLLVLSLSIGLAYRQYLVSLNKKLEKGQTEAFEANAKAMEQSAEYVLSIIEVAAMKLTFIRKSCHTTLQEEKEIVHSFRYLY